MKTRGTVPEWATELVARVCKDYGRRPAVITSWTRKDRTYSSGVTWDRRRNITIVEGTDALEARTVLLHELAHYLSPVGWDHNLRFWTRCWELHIVYGHLPTAIRTEFAYKAKAQLALVRLVAAYASSQA